MSRDILGRIDAVIGDWEVSPDAARYLPYQPATPAELAIARQLTHLTGLDGYAALAVVHGVKAGESHLYRHEYTAAATAARRATVGDMVQVYMFQVTERMREPLERITRTFESYNREMARQISEAFGLLLRYGPDKPAGVPPKNGPPQHGPGHRAYGKRGRRRQERNR